MVALAVAPASLVIILRNWQLHHYEISYFSYFVA